MESLVAGAIDMSRGRKERNGEVEERYKIIGGFTIHQ